MLRKSISPVFLRIDIYSVSLYCTYSKVEKIYSSAVGKVKRAKQRRSFLALCKVSLGQRIGFFTEISENGCLRHYRSLAWIVIASTA